MRATHTLLSVFIIISCFFVSCKSNQAAEDGNTSVAAKAAEDSANKQINSMIDKIVDELAPPDTDYTGEFFQKYESGIIKVKGFFRFGKRHGQWVYYYPNGYLWSEALYDNGKMNGNSKVYYENSKLYYEGNYSHDIAVGMWTFYDSTGTPVLRRTYDSTGKVLFDKNLALQKN